MRYLFLIAALMLSRPTMAQSWYGAILKDLGACQQKAWQECPEPLACFEIRAAAKIACRVTCEHDLEKHWAIAIAKDLRADELACVSGLAGEQDPGLTCIDRIAWRQSEIAARTDAFDFAVTDYPYLAKLPPSEIVNQVYKVAERGFLAQGLCTIAPKEERIVTLLYTTALAINRMRAAGSGAVKWEQAQALSLEALRARRGY